MKLRPPRQQQQRHRQLPPPRHRATIDATASTGSIATVIDNLDAAINTINDSRADFGATQSRFDAIISTRRRY